MAIDSSLSPWHWLPFVVSVKAETKPGCWDDVIVVCFKQHPYNLGHNENYKIVKGDISDILRQWQALVMKRSTPKPENQQILRTEVAMSTKVLSLDRSIDRGRMRRRGRRLNCVNFTEVDPADSSVRGPKISEMSLSSLEIKGTDLIDEPNRGRLRRRARRMIIGSPELPRINGFEMIPNDSEHKIWASVDSPGSSVIDRQPVSNSCYGSLPTEKSSTDLKIGLRSTTMKMTAKCTLGKAVQNRDVPHLVASVQGSNVTHPHGYRPDDCEYVFLRDPGDIGSLEVVLCSELQGNIKTRERISSSKREVEVVAYFTDAAGMKKKSDGWFSHEWFRSITAQDSLPDLGTAVKHLNYWKRLGLLTLSPDDHLPYSKGYCFSHFNPPVTRREREYGMLDVDAVGDGTTGPKWRATWTFKSECECDEKWECLHFFSHPGIWKHPESSNFRVCSKVLYVRPCGRSHALLTALQDFFELPYYSHWPHEFFRSHKLSSFRPRKYSRDWIFHDVSSHGQYYGSWPKYNEVKIPTTSESYKSTNGFDFRLTYALTHFIGLDKEKNISSGLRAILHYADHGCSDARAMIKRIFEVYGQRLEKDDETVRAWLLEGASQGSFIAFQDLQQAYSDSAEFQAVQRKRKLSFDISCPKTLDYDEHVRPVIDLSDLSSLRMRLDSRKKSHGARKAENALPVWIGQYESNFRNQQRAAYKFGGLLHMACVFGFKDAASILLDAGARVNETNSSKRLHTPLLCALRRGYGDIARLLVENGATCEQPLGQDSVRENDYPSPLHYLVYLEDEGEASDLAELLEAHGADVNGMCEADALESHEMCPVNNLDSLTPLHWAIMNGKSILARNLVRLGAWFATFRSTSAEKGNSGPKTFMLLETPCTDCDILELFFEQLTAEACELPLEFSKTPLGLLVSEDDSPQRRLRHGFHSENQILSAFQYLLCRQAFDKDLLLWSTIRHDHLTLTQYLINRNEWPIESRCYGLTCLQTAILYGRKDIVSFLLSRGADAKAVSSRRRLTCLHLLALVPRDTKTDTEILQMIVDRGIEVDAMENCNSLTALHISVRNRKLHMVKTLLDHGADPLIPVLDQIQLLSQERRRKTKDQQSMPCKLVKDTTILGEVLLQCKQDGFYSLKYAEKLLRLVLAHSEATARRHLYIDRAKTVTILHILALLSFPHAFRIFRFVLRLLHQPGVNVLDLNGDTPLHYACASLQWSNVKALLKLNSNPDICNRLGLTPFQLSIFSPILLNPLPYSVLQTKADQTEKCFVVDKLRGLVPVEEQEAHKRPPNWLQLTLNALESRGIDTQHPLRELALAWCSEEAGRRGSEKYFGMDT